MAVFSTLVYDKSQNLQHSRGKPIDKLFVTRGLEVSSVKKDQKKLSYNEV